MLINGVSAGKPPHLSPMFLVKKLLIALILPPTGPLLLAFVGLWLATKTSRRWRNTGLCLAGGSLLLLLLLALPATARWLDDLLEKPAAVSPDELNTVQAIVILGAGTYRDAPEYGGDSLAGSTLERVRYGAWLARKTQLPILASGGAPFGGRAEAEVIAEVLRDEFAVPARWTEAASRDTSENANFSAALLRRAGISRIALVSHQNHLVRAVPLFAQHGLLVLPAPTLLDGPRRYELDALLPSAGSLSRSSAALHEHLGIIYNRLWPPT